MTDTSSPNNVNIGQGAKGIIGQTVIGATIIEHQQVITPEAIELNPFQARSPYKALKRFDVDDSEYFFGRYQLTHEMQEVLKNNNLILVLGASGSGKSSVVRAKLIPEFLSASSHHHDFILTPGDDPFRSLYESLIGQGKIGPDKDYYFKPDKAKFVLECKSDVLAQVVYQLKDKDSEWLIFIDQFEELFTRCPSLEQRQNFIKSLTQIAESKDYSVKIVLAMRADFLGEFNPYPRFGKLLQRQIHLVNAMPEDELELAIKGPAAKHGVRFERGLAKEIVADVQGQAGSLPLMQYTLDRLWEYEVNLDKLTDKLLNTQNYQALGKVRGALDNHVNEIYRELGDVGQQAAKRIFLSLVKVFTTDGVEKRVSQSVSRSALQGDAVPKTIDRLINENLLVSSSQNLSQTASLTQNGNNLKQQATIEMAHEILLTSWDKLRDWIQEAQVILLIKSRLGEDMRRWNEQKQADQELLKGSVLAKILELKEKHLFELQSVSLSKDEQDYITKSQQFQKRELNRARGLATVAVVGAIITSVFGFVAWEQTQQAKLNQAQSLGRYSQSLFNQGKELEAFVQAIKAEKILQEQDATDPEVMNALQNIHEGSERNRLEGHTDVVWGVSFSPDGKTLASGSSDKTIKLWDRETGREIRTLKGHTDVVTSISFSPDGKTLASGSEDKTIKLWNLETGKEIRTLKSVARVYGVSFSSDGKTLASGSGGSDGKTLASRSGDNTIKLWNPETGKEIRTLKGHAGVVWSISFNLDGKTLASSSADKTIKLWNVATGKQIRTLKGHAGDVLSINFSLDGKTLASCSRDKTIKLWNVVTGKQILTLKDHAGEVLSVSFSPDRKSLASGSHDQTIKLWNVETGKEIRTLKGHEGKVWSVSFSPDSKTLASGSEDKTIRLWDPNTEKETRTFKRHEGRVWSVSFSRDGKTLASSSWDQTIKLWDRETGKEIRTLKGDKGKGVLSVSFSSNGKILASSGDGQMIKLWNPETGKEIRTLEGHEARVWSVTFSPDGKTLASGSEDKTIRLWNPETGKEISTLKGHGGKVWSVTFSPDGKILASGSEDGTIKLWNPETGKEISTLKGHGGKVLSVTFNPDEKTLASGSEDGTIKLWDREAGKEIRTLKGHGGKVLSVSFNPDGKTLASGNEDGTIKLWNPETGKEISTLKSNARGVYSVSFSPDGKTLVSGSDDGTIKLWDLNLNSLMGRSCDWVRNYLTYNPKVSEGDRHLCDGIGSQK